MSEILAFTPTFFKLIDFDTICVRKDFSLPPDILTPEVLADRAAKASARISGRYQKLNRNYAFDGDNSTHNKMIKRSYGNGNGNGESYSTTWKSFQGRPYPFRKRKNSRLLDEEEIRALPKQPSYEKYNARAFEENPFMKQTTPSTLIKGTYKLNAEQIERSFLQVCFSEQVNSLIKAAEWLEKNDVPVEQELNSESNRRIIETTSEA
ncbi:15487_t:CDS:2 [Acaulospora morrowiae]|uniref:15487_t:CDS:1 n=1 Tax=Acaulospora morrowiae TaxID=94023 RepID=A0A9N9G3W0_9GLOM|nr:15487_t:CDS:2 [Acaulospora morrowiae]